MVSFLNHHKRLSSSLLSIKLCSVMKNIEKKPMGRQKIEIKKIEKKNNLQVTFSKRRTGLFKKAAQLSALCGAEVAVIVMSPANNVYTFGKPSADSVIDRFLARNSSPSNPKTTPSSPPHDVLHSCEAVGGLEEVKEREKTVEESKEVSGGGFRWDEPIDELGLDELEQYKASLEVLKKKVRTQANEIAMAGASSSNFSAPGGIAMEQNGFYFNHRFF